jgi:hypothetical protein
MSLTQEISAPNKRSSLTFDKLPAIVKEINS